MFLKYMLFAIVNAKLPLEPMDILKMDREQAKASLDSIIENHAPKCEELKFKYLFQDETLQILNVYQRDGCDFFPCQEAAQLRRFEECRINEGDQNNCEFSTFTDILKEGIEHCDTIENNKEFIHSRCSNVADNGNDVANCQFLLEQETKCEIAPRNDNAHKFLYNAAKNCPLKENQSKFAEENLSSLINEVEEKRQTIAEKIVTCIKQQPSNNNNNKLRLY